MDYFAAEGIGLASWQWVYELQSPSRMVPSLGSWRRALGYQGYVAYSPRHTQPGSGWLWSTRESLSKEGLALLMHEQPAVE